MNSNLAVNPWRFLRTLLLSYAVTAVLLFLFAFLLYKMKLGVTEVSWGVGLIYLLSCALGGFVTGKQAGSRRLLWGLAFGALYFAVLLILSLAVGGGLQGSARSVITAAATCLGGSGAGAIIS